MLRKSTCVIALSVAATSLAIRPLEAQDGSSVLTGDEARRLVSERTETTAADRAALDAFLDTRAVRDVSRAAGIDIGRLESAVATLGDAEIERLRPRLGDAEAALAGGDTLVIGSTTIIIALLILILILVA